MAFLSTRCRHTLETRCTLFVLFSLLLLLFGVLFMVYSSFQYKTTETITKKDTSRYGVVIDAGGSGTRLVIYNYNGDKTFDQLKYITCEDEGLGTYSEGKLPEVREKFTKCLREAGKSLPANKSVPLYMGATAGMRLLKMRNSSVYNDIWTLVKTVLANSSFDVKTARTLSGSEEAQYAWVAANYLKNTLPGDDKIGIIDFGSSSIQLAFMLDDAPNKTEDIQTVSIDGQNITIYGHSYLCYGKREMERRFLANLAKEANFSSVVANPCYFKDYSKNYTSSFLWAPPCSSGDYARSVLGEDIHGPLGQAYTFQGTGNGSQCMLELSNLIISECTDHKTCGMNNVYQPIVKGPLMALSVFAYAATFLGLPKDAGVESFNKKYHEFCAKSWNEIESLNIPGTAPKYRSGRCFDSAYSYFLLTKGFKINKANWDLSYVNKVNGKSLQWTLGLIYLKKSELQTSVKDFKGVTTETNPGLIGVLVLGAIMLLLAVILLAMVIVSKGSTERRHIVPDQAI